MFVRVSDELYERRRVFQEYPVTVRMSEPNEHGEVDMTFTTHICPHCHHHSVIDTTSGSYYTVS